jgi:hypothetical protein
MINKTVIRKEVKPTTKIYKNVIETVPEGRESRFAGGGGIVERVAFYRYN